MREESQAGERAVTYCIVPLALAGTLHETLRRFYREDASVEVIVERRSEDRRASSGERRAATAGGPDRTTARANRGNTPAVQGAVRADRRTVRAVDGRRVAERRASLVPVSPPALPRRARRYADQLVFAERLEPSGQREEDLDSARLVTRFQAGDRDAFADLYMRYFDRVYGYLRVLLKNRDNAEEAAQQVFLRALEALPAYERRRQPFRAWLFTIVRNYALTQLGRQGRVDLLEPAELTRRQDCEARPEPDLDVLTWISDRELLMFVERLPLPQRQVLVLRHMLDLPASETAAVLGITPVAVRSLQYRALRVLEERLTAIGRGPKKAGRRAPMRAGVRQAPVLRFRRFALLSK